MCVNCRKGQLGESIMYYEEFVLCAKEQKQNEMVVRGCNAAGYVYNLVVRTPVYIYPLTLAPSGVVTGEQGGAIPSPKF